MAQTRVDLDRLLRTTLGSTNVYFDPPESFKLKYPCVVYSYESNAEFHADDSTYHRRKRYSMTYITKNADDPKADEFADLRYCKLSRAYTADGLWHYAFELYY